MSANIGKNGIVTASLIDGSNKVSIMEEDITVGANLIIGGSGKKKEGFFQNATAADDGELEFRFVTNAGTGTRYPQAPLNNAFEIAINDYTPGEYLTWSYDIMLVRKDDTFAMKEHWMGQRFGNAGTVLQAWQPVTQHNITLPTTLNVWEHREKTIQIPATKYPQPGNTAIQSAIQFSNTATTAGTIIIRLKNVKLERVKPENLKATPWCPNKADNLGETQKTYKSPIMANDFIEI